MLRVGLTGGLATGKSFVGRELARLGCLLIEADKLGHQVLLPGAEAYDAVVAEFGAAILDANGFIDRKLLAAEVFGKPDRLERLNALVHPLVRARARREEQEFFARNPDGIAVHEAAILVETGGHLGFDKLIVAVCREDQQIARAMARDSLSAAQVRERLARQMPMADKRKFADYVIDTSGPEESTLRQTREVFRELSALARAPR